MKEGGDTFRDVLDQSVLASLRELQEAGDPDIVAEVGGLFIKHSPEKVDAIMQSVEKDDAKGLQLAAHSLKSSSANVGAMKLHGLCRELEAQARDRQLADAAERVADLEREFLAAQAILRRELPEDSG